VANVQIYKYQFLQNNPYGGFVAGDVLDIYIDPTLAVVPTGAFGSYTGITLYLNGVLTGSHASFILSYSPSIISVQDFNTQTCITTTLLNYSRTSFFPFANYTSLENHYSCTVNPPTCDLVVVGVPTVVPATTATEADGAITLTATSTNSVKYKIGSDFAYDDGTSQSSGVFTGLLPADYRIYLRDEANCAVNILVTVPVDNSYLPKFRLEYEDIRGWFTKIDIAKRGYVGAVSEVCGGGTPFTLSLRGEGGIDKFEPILASQADLQLLSESDQQFLELYTNDPNLYRIYYYKDTGRMLPAFVPASLDTLDDWLETGVGYTWTNIGTTTPDFSLTGSGASKKLYTNYGFEVGRSYDFDYEFSVTGAGGFNEIRIVVPGTLYDETLTIDVSAGGTFTGTFSLTAQAGANQITIYISQSSSATTYSVIDFTNTTASDGEMLAGYELKWVGKILPQQYSEEYKFPPYYVNVTATCSIPELSEFYLIQDDGQKYYGDIKLIELIAFCLGKLKMDLPIRVGVNLYAVDMDQTDSDDPLDQAHSDFEAFYLNNQEPTLDYVLAEILKTFGARIVQWEGRWNIVRVEEMAAAYDYRDFDKDGNYLTNGTYNPVIDIDYPDNDGDLLLANNDSQLELRPGYGIIKVVYDLGLKPNILENGDFRLTSFYYQPDNVYFFTVNKQGWVLVNAGYALQESFEYIDENNIAYAITASEDILYDTTGGEAYLQSANYSVRMGANNQLKISLRYKISRTMVVVGAAVFGIEVPYIKCRIKVQYGSLYLQANGTWSSTDSYLTFFIKEYDKYQESEIVALQPTSGTPTSGMDLNIRVYHAYAYHAQFQSVGDLEDFVTFSGGDEVIPTGYKTELRDAFTAPSYMYYYELKESTDAASGYDIVRPDDYNAITNPRQWLLLERKFIGTVSGANVFPMFIDKVVVNFLTDKKDPFDSIIRYANAESNNKDQLEKKLILGSSGDLINTEVRYGIDLGAFFPNPKPGLTITSQNILSYDLIYAGFLRDVNGLGYELWARDGVSESDKLHGIYLKMYAKQYSRSWRLFRSSYYMNSFFGLIDVMRETNDSNRIYLPIGLSLDDKQCMYSGESLELITDLEGDGSSPYTSGFTVGFGGGYD
jgi:hypothetical protein